MSRPKFFMVDQRRSMELNIRTYSFTSDPLVGKIRSNGYRVDHKHPGAGSPLGIKLAHSSFDRVLSRSNVIPSMLAATACPRSSFMYPLWRASKGCVRSATCSLGVSVHSGVGAAFLTCRFSCHDLLGSSLPKLSSRGRPLQS